MHAHGGKQGNEAAPVQIPDRDEEVAARGDSVAGQGVLLQSPPDEHGGLGVQAHGLTDDSRGVGHGPHLLQGGYAIPNYCIYLRTHVGLEQFRSLSWNIWECFCPAGFVMQKGGRRGTAILHCMLQRR